MTNRHLIGTLLALTAVIAAAGCDATRDPMNPSSDHVTTFGENSLTSAGAEPALLCHVTGRGAYKLLELKGSAAGAHRAHGDAAVGESVPGDATKVFNETCTPVQGLVITSGTWTVGVAGPPFQFNLQGANFAAVGSWAAYASGNLCFSQCGASERLSLDLTFENAFPSGVTFFAPGTLNGAFVEFGGSLHFDATDIQVPLPTPDQAFQPLQVTTPFKSWGTLKAWDVLNRRDPLLVFEQFVVGDGIATVEFLAGPVGSTTLTLLRPTYDFAAGGA